MYDILVKIGSAFSQKDIDRAIELGNTYDPDIVSMDSTFVIRVWIVALGQRAFGLVLLEYLDGKIFVKMAEEYPHVRYEDICIKIKSILQSLNRWNPNQEI